MRQPHQYQFLSTSLLLINALFVLSSCGTQDIFASELLENPLLSPPTDASAPPLVTPSGPEPYLQLSSGSLHNRCREGAILRGTSEMLVWAEDPQDPTPVREIARSGANAIRIVWSIYGNISDLDVIIQNVLDVGMLPLVEFHDRNQSTDIPYSVYEELDAYITSTDFVTLMRKYEATMLLEYGGLPPSAVDWNEWQLYSSRAVRAIRETGVRMPVSFKAPPEKTDLKAMSTAMQQIMAADRFGNSWFALDYWQDEMKEELNRWSYLRALSIPFYISEFSGYYDPCPAAETDLSLFLESAAQQQISWFAWSWGSVKNTNCGSEGALDMTSNGTVEGLLNWGLFVAKESSYGISKTAVPIPALRNDECPAN